MDIPLGAVFMVSLCMAVTKGENYYRKAFAVSLVSSMLVMIKPSGIIFVSVVCLVYLMNEYMNRGFCMSRHDIGKLISGGGYSLLFHYQN